MSSHDIHVFGPCENNFLGLVTDKILRIEGK